MLYATIAADTYKHMLTDRTMTHHKFGDCFKLKPTLVGPSPSHYRSLNW